MKRFIVRVFARILSFDTTERILRFFMATQGLGWVVSVRESGEVQALKDQLKDVPMPVIFDVGGNVGDFTSNAIEVLPSSRVYIFEPSATHFSIISDRFKGNSNIVLFNLGLSNEKSTMNLYKEKEVTGNATVLVRDLGYLDFSQSIEEQCAFAKGDDLIPELALDTIDYLKLDVEGWELPALEGFKNAFDKKIIKRCQFEFTSAQIERRESFVDFYDFFSQKGYSVHLISPHGALEKISKTNPKHRIIFDSYFASNYLAIID